MLLLSEAEEGLSGAELAVAMSDDDHAEVTVRAELSRVRQQLGPIRLGSRPYRLSGVRTDVAGLRDDLAAGRLRQAVARYRGPVLPTSGAPGVVESLKVTLRKHPVGGVLVALVVGVVFLSAAITQVHGALKALGIVSDPPPATAPK